MVYGFERIESAKARDLWIDTTTSVSVMGHWQFKSLYSLHISGLFLSAVSFCFVGPSSRRQTRPKKATVMGKDVDAPDTFLYLRSRDFQISMRGRRGRG
jgi:hypothetical protein